MLVHSEVHNVLDSRFAPILYVEKGHGVTKGHNKNIEKNSNGTNSSKKEQKNPILFYAPKECN